MFKDVSEDDFHTHIKPQFITGLYDENRLALIRRIKIYTGGDVKIVNLPPAGAYNLPVSETMQVELQSMLDHPLVEVVNQPYMEIIEKSVIETIEEPILEAVEIPVLQFFGKPFKKLLPSIEVLPKKDLEVIQEPLLNGRVESTALFKNIISDEPYRYQKIGSSPIEKLNLPDQVLCVKPVRIPGWDGGATFIGPPLFLTIPYLKLFARILMRKAKQMILEMLLRMAFKILVTIVVNLLLHALRIMAKKVQTMLKSFKEKN